LRRDLGVSLTVGTLQIGYRETSGRRIEVDYTHKVLHGATGEFARVKMAFEPNAPNSGYRFESRAPNDAVPRDLVRGVEEGVGDARRIGPVDGFPIIDFTAILLDGAFHPNDSTVQAFAIAAGAAFKAAMRQADCKLLEPIMKVEVALPRSFADEVVGAIMADLDLRRCEHRGLEDRGNISVLHALVPLANMLGYGNSLGPWRCNVSPTAWPSITTRRFRGISMTIRSVLRLACEHEAFALSSPDPGEANIAKEFGLVVRGGTAGDGSAGRVQ